MKQILKDKVFLLALICVMFAGNIMKALAFEGSTPTQGQKYYLYNIYQAKFLGADSKLQSPNIGSPATFTVASGNAMVINGATWILAEKNGYYQLKNGSSFFAFEDKKIDTDNPNDENRCLYVGGGVTCEPTSNDTDRSYWQLISEDEYAAWQTKKKFTVASLNVDGMPKSISVYGVYTVNLNPDATEGPGATAIGNRLRASGFDVVGVSEDFNFHSELWSAAWNNGSGIHYNAMTHRNKIDGSRSGILSDYLAKKPVADTDGLCLFYRINGGTTIATPSQETYVQWNDHYGYTDNGADGLIKKGYRYYLITLADGTQFDLYTMHMDADSDPEDNAARASQLTQLVAAIKATHNGRPIVIIGDSNCRYTRDKVKECLIDPLNADSRFTCRDPWIQYGRNNTYPAYGTNSIMASENGYLRGEVVDKIWYVNNTESAIRVVAESYCQDLSFVDESGSPLCDHKPCVVTFSYHNYDPTIDDVAVIETTEEAVYLRNRGTGRFLKSGGAFDTHAIVGNYPLGITMELNNGKYVLKSPVGYITANDGTQHYIDGESTEERSVKDWTLLEQDGFYVFAYNGRALSANDPYYFNDNPNYRWVILDVLNPADKLQQWEVLTKEQMLAEMEKASAINPINVSWLMTNPNFDSKLNNTKWNNNISSSAKRMTSNLSGGLADASSDSNPCGEAYVAKCPDTHFLSSCDHAQTWDINQTITDIPNGYYRVSCQAFQRISNSTTGGATVKFYGNSVEKDVELMYNLKEVTFSGMGSTKTGNYYYPNTMTEASKYFNAGYYQHELIVLVTNGTLKIGIKKTSDTGKDNNCWTCFDNFQLYYLGTSNPNRTYPTNVIADTRKAEMVNGALKLTGTWREVDMSELATKINTNKPLVIDATSDNYLICRPEIQTANAPANMMIKVAKANEIANDKNVIAEGKCASFVLTDKQNFAPQSGFVAQTVGYARTNTQGYNTVCLPFDVKASDFPETCTLYVFKETSKDVVRFTEASTEDVIAAGTPILVSDETTETGDAAKWQMNLSTDRNVVASVSGNTDSEQTTGLNGAFMKRSLGTGYYKLNSEGTKFVTTTSSSTITPFRFYLNEPAESVKSFVVSFSDGTETTIDELLNDKDTNVEVTYDLNGRRVLNVTHPGIYIKGGKKVYIK